MDGEIARSVMAHLRCGNVIIFGTVYEDTSVRRHLLHFSNGGSPHTTSISRVFTVTCELPVILGSRTVILEIALTSSHWDSLSWFPGSGFKRGPLIGQFSWSWRPLCNEACMVLDLPQMRTAPWHGVNDDNYCTRYGAYYGGGRPAQLIISATVLTVGPGKSLSDCSGQCDFENHFTPLNISLIVTAASKQFEKN